MAKKKVKKIVHSFDTPEKAIKERARKLPINECLISNNWHKLKMAEVIISRKHANGNITYGVFLTDLYCTGLRDTFYSFNISQQNYEAMLQRMNKNVSLIPCSYQLAHNIIYGSIEYAEQFGFYPEKNFAITEYILEEDNEDIPLMDINFGYKGKPTILLLQDNSSENDINTLRKNAGEGNYYLFNISQSSMHSDPENAMFEDSNISLDNFLKNSPKDNFSEGYFIDFVKNSFNKKLIKNKELQEKNKLTYYINDLLGFQVTKEEGLIKLKDPDTKDKYFEFYDAINDQKTRKVKKYIPEIEEYYNSHKDIPEFAALLLKCYNELNDTEKFEQLIQDSLTRYPEDFSTRSIALDYFLAKNEYDKVLELFNHSYTLKDYVKEKKSVNLTEARLFHLAYFYYFLEKENIVQAEEYLKVLSMYQNDEKAIKKIILKLTLAKMFFISEREQIEQNLPKYILELL